MKGHYVLDVEGLPELNQIVQAKAVELGCEDKIGSGTFDHPTLFVNLDSSYFSAHEKNVKEYEFNYGLGDYIPITIQEFLRIESPPLKVALALVITDDLGRVDEAPKLVTAEDLAKVDYKVTRGDVMAAAEVACSALGV